MADYERIIDGVDEIDLARLRSIGEGLRRAVDTPLDQMPADFHTVLRRIPD